MDCVESAKVSLSAEKAYIRHSRDRLGLAQIRQAIEGAGARRSLLFKGGESLEALAAAAQSLPDLGILGSSSRLLGPRR